MVLSTLARAERTITIRRVRVMSRRWFREVPKARPMKAWLMA